MARSTMSTAGLGRLAPLQGLRTARERSVLVEAMVRHREARDALDRRDGACDDAVADLSAALDSDSFEPDALVRKTAIVELCARLRDDARAEVERLGEAEDQARKAWHAADRQHAVLRERHARQRKRDLRARDDKALLAALEMRAAAHSGNLP